MRFLLCIVCTAGKLTSTIKSILKDPYVKMTTRKMRAASEKNTRPTFLSMLDTGSTDESENGIKTY